MGNKHYEIELSDDRGKDSKLGLVLLVQVGVIAEFGKNCTISAKNQPTAMLNAP
jgi:hypothetical protein